MVDWLESPTALSEQYADATNLNARIALHEQYSTAETGLREWQFDQLARDAVDVLAVGCGPADLWAENCERIPSAWSVTLTDFSRGMIEDAHENLADCDRTFAFGAADVARLPFEDDSFDAVTANHMLYHVPDREDAIAELRRVLRPDGTLYATTNGEQNMVELYDVLEAVLGERPARATAFTLENGGSQLEQHFDDVRIRRYEHSLAVTDPDAPVAYALSRDDVDHSLASDLHEAFAEAFENKEGDHDSDGGDDDDGVFHITKSVGMFRASS
ncbi:class I SAM-dependent methyltransferase [Halocatena marina]|uniref:class I SAM-dependent methyltransferase n=1 Tax=Halocatena marina TaxID=2934937 RepID=UPI00200D880C|nr:class I SAM-dependent methyltransferase [Halocatena marina]